MIYDTYLGAGANDIGRCDGTSLGVEANGISQCDGGVSRPICGDGGLDRSIRGDGESAWC